MKAIKTHLSILEMLKRLQYSENQNCANIAKRVLSGETTIKHELKYAGGFMTAVLEGDYLGAIRRADQPNTVALLTPVHYELN